jgi:predicted nucleic acid-binding protein
MGWRTTEGPKGAFVHSSAWFAAAVARDANNERAKAILSREDFLVTTDHVMLETWSLLSSRYGHAAAERFLDGLRETGAKLETLTLGDFEGARADEEAFPDEAFSLSDRLSFSVMRRLALTRVATFSEAFASYRYGRARDKSFAVLTAGT